MTIVGLYSDSRILGGAERSLLNLAAAYRGDFDIVVCSPHPELVEAAESIEGVRTHRLRTRTAPVAGTWDHRREFRRLGIQLLQVTLANPFASRPAILGGVLARIPTIGVEQLVLPSRRRRGSFVKRCTAALQAGVVAVGERSAEDLGEYFAIRPHRITVVHNGVPARAYDRPTPGSTPLVGCAARLEDQKGVDLLLQAMTQVPEARREILGDGGRRRSLEQLRDELGLADRVTFRGWIDDAPAVMAGWDIFALASRDEAFPLTIVEAMLAGTPVIATDVGSVAEAVRHDDTGLLVESGDIDAMAAAIRRLIDDVELRARFTERGREHASTNFTDTAMADGYERLWRAVLDGADGRSSGRPARGSGRSG